MKEKILVVDNVNGTELMRTLARFGSGQFLLRIFDPVHLAAESLVRSGKTLTERFLSRNDEVYIMDDLIRKSPYFAVSSFSDSHNLTNTLHSLRMMIKDDEENIVKDTLNKGEFKDKNEAILDIYQRYIGYLKDRGLIDAPALIRRAMATADKIDAEFIILKEYPLEPLERSLVEELSLEEVKETSILELFGKEERPLRIDDHVSAYGTVNELEDIISHIYEKKIPFDKCLIVTPKDAYGQAIYDLCQDLDIPVTYGRGLSINNSSAFVVLKLLLRHEDNAYGIDTLRELLFCDLLDREKFLADIDGDEKDLEEVIEMAGNLKISFDEKKNDERYLRFEPNALKDWRKRDHTEQVKKLKDIFNKGLTGFLMNYSIIRDPLDVEGLNYICRTIEDYLKNTSRDIRELLPVLSKRYICKETSKEGHIHVTDIRSALSCLRENVFIIGMSSANFPGLPKENYLLLDSDIDLFGDEGHTSIRKIEEKTKSLDDLLRVGSGLGLHIFISYSDFNIAALKAENPSSYLFDLYQKLSHDDDYDGFKKSFRKTSYFKHRLRKDERLGQAYIEGKEIVVPKKTRVADTVLPSIDKYFSPTQIETYFNCPRQFYLSFILGIEATEEDDPYVIISARDTGDLYHKLMEEKANKDMSEEDFIKLADGLFEQFMTTRPQIHEDAKKRAKDDFLDMCLNGYRQDPDYHVEAAERFQKSECYGIKLKGFPDRIERDDKGDHLIADFKTGRNVKHDPSDPVTCLQVLLYAYMSERELGYDIKYCQYRYPRFNYVVTCPYDDGNKDKLSIYMNRFKNALDKGYFPCAASEKRPDACKYCRFGSICGKDEEGEEDE